jgi:hypothetical protein
VIRTSKVKKISKDQNVESVKRLLVDQTIENQNVKKNVESQISSKMSFNVLIFFDAIGNIRMLKVFWANTYGVLHMGTKACGGLGEGQLG